MKGYLVTALILALLTPAAADAAWWNPLSWKKRGPEPAATTTDASAALDVTLVPSIGDLNVRIAELEDKLQKALSENAVLKMKVDFLSASKAAPAAEKAVSRASAAPSSQSEIEARVKPSLVLVETATTSASGVIIDPSGLILVPAHAIWIQSADKTVVGALEEVSVVLSSGARKKAKLVGIHELADAAVLKIADKGSYPAVKLGSQASVQQGDRAYVAGVASNKGGSGGEPFLSGTVSRTTTGSIEVAVDEKPLDNGGAIFDGTGQFIGIPNRSTCKVLEEMKTCLRYSVTSGTLRNSLAQLIEGMRLYKDKVSNKTEELVRGQLEGIYRGTKQSATLDYAITYVTGENSFDFMNKRLVDDQKGKITKLYLTKLKTAAANIYSAIDFLENQADALRVFLINEEASIAGLGDYQRKVLQSIAADNSKKLKEYQEKASFWSKKKNEYDAHLVDTSKANHDYLMTEGVFVEEAAEYLKKERSWTLDRFSGEAVDIF